MFSRYRKPDFTPPAVAPQESAPAPAEAPRKAAAQPAPADKERKRKEKIGEIKVELHRKRVANL